MRLTRRYKGKTPITVELLSDALLIISQTITGYAIFADNHTVAWISLITGVLGKILARFVEESNDKEGLDDNVITTSCCNNDACSCKGKPS